MGYKEICINNKPCELMKSVNRPKYGSKTILTDSCWEYVSSKSLPESACPLTSYYCILNAAKALLRYKGIDDKHLKNHGISSVRLDSEKTNLKEACTAVKGAGVLPELSKYYGFNMKTGHYSMASLFYNIPCVHRAYCITFSKPEIFVPISKPVFVKKTIQKRVG